MDALVDSDKEPQIVIRESREAYGSEPASRMRINDWRDGPFSGKEFGYKSNLCQTLDAVRIEAGLQFSQIDGPRILDDFQLRYF